MHRPSPTRALLPVSRLAALLVPSVALLSASAAAPVASGAKPPRATPAPAASDTLPAPAPKSLRAPAASIESAPEARAAATPATPNIVFVIIDDAGVDQFERWNPAGVELPKTPVIDSLCDQGVRFSNVWSMPQCSPSRVAMMTGRFPFRTGVMNACLETAPPR